MCKESEDLVQHKCEMQKQKETVKDRVSQATEDKGIVLVLTGNGKGKSSSGFGMALRCLGHGMKVGVVQFIKGKWKTGEQLFFKSHPDVSYFQMGAGFTWDTQDKTADVQRVEHCWLEAEKMLQDPQLNYVLLDELNIVTSYNYLDVERVITALKNKPDSMHVALTGRDADQQLIDFADTVTRIESPKHAFANGIRAQRGIEF